MNDFTLQPTGPFTGQVPADAYAGTLTGGGLDFTPPTPTPNIHEPIPEMKLSTSTIPTDGAAATPDSLMTQLTNAYTAFAVGSIATSAINAGFGIASSLVRMDIIEIQADIQKKQLTFQENTAAKNLQATKDIETIKQEQLTKMQATNKAVNESKVKRAEAENKLAEVSTAIKQAKQTEKTGKLDTRRLDRFFDPRDTRLHRSYGQPTVRR